MTKFMLLLAVMILPATVSAQVAAPFDAAQGGPVNPLWHEEKTRNYLPHMTWPEVQDLRTRTDMAIIPVASMSSTACICRSAPIT